MTKKKTKKKVAKSRSTRSKTKSAKKPVSKRTALRTVSGFLFMRLAVIIAVGLLGYTAYLDIQIRKQFEGQKWALPAHVYTRPMELYLGQAIDRKLILDELEELGYRATDASQVGEYQFTESRLIIFQRAFRFWDGLRQAQKLTVDLINGRVERIQVDAVDTEIVRLEPRLFGSVSPLSHEDRTLLKLEDTPQQLIDALIAVEDRQYYSHFGVNPLGIARALVRNVSAGRVVQGGSTLTQQLVKNYYLNSDQTLSRKITEAIMSVLLEIHYSKQEILQAYLNDINISQAGNRAIHGFALGSQHFYGRPLQELDLSELALLAGIIKGPSYYNPIRNPERAIQRRNVVLKTMLEVGYIDQAMYQESVGKQLTTSRHASQAAPLSYPAFLGFLRRDLQNDYQQEDLLNDGLQIHTTLNPRIQSTLEGAVESQLTQIEKSRNLVSGTLQIAAAVIRTDNGEVAALVGDRKARFSGYNRALDSRRPVGSLLKPFVFLAALEQPGEYSLATTVHDKAITVTQKGSPDWTPQNYDGVSHGDVMLVDALSKSYNLATVNTGMEIGVDQVAKTIRRVGVNTQISEFPSLLLGAVPMTVLDVSQLYLTLASGGFKTPVKGIRSVLSNEHEPLARYPLSVEQVVQPQFNSLINYALQEVIRSGTGRVVLRGFDYDYGLAGKTGTTDDYRDSWFAGFSGNYLTVVWVGRDDNQPTGLTGASGAAKVWAKIMQNIPMRRFELGFHEDIIQQQVVYSTNEVLQDCSQVRHLPVLLESLPLENTPCPMQMQYDPNNEEETHFEVEQGTPKKKRKSFWRRIFG